MTEHMRIGTCGPNNSRFRTSACGMPRQWGCLSVNAFICLSGSRGDNFFMRVHQNAKDGGAPDLSPHQHTNYTKRCRKSPRPHSEKLMQIQRFTVHFTATWCVAGPHGVVCAHGNLSRISNTTCLDSGITTNPNAHHLFEMCDRTVPSTETGGS
jgi:hypothetical protein